MIQAALTIMENSGTVGGDEFGAYTHPQMP